MTETPLARTIAAILQRSASILLIGSAANTYAQQEAQKMEELVVTGTPGGAELRKADASFAITTVDSEAIERFAPKSTADLLKTVPGVWVESSGGTSGANVFVRGFPGTGDADFLTIQIEGAPIFPVGTLSFLENTQLFRLDETIERMEGLRGGPNTILSNGQPGLTTNYVLKKGGEETEGVFKYSTSDYDLQRLDLMASGRLGEGLYYMVGGYVSSSPGVRDAGFSAEEGQQFTINITKDFDRGSINAYHRVTDDHGTWYLPSALDITDASYTQVGPLTRRVPITFSERDPQTGDSRERTETFDLGEGRGFDGSVSGARVNVDFDNNWEFINNVVYTQGDANTLGYVPNGAAVRVGDLLADPDVDPAAVVTGPLVGAITGDAIDDASFIQQFGAWVVQKEIENFANDLMFQHNFDDGHTLTIGYYTSALSADEFWTLGNFDYHVVEQNGEPVSGIACNEADVDSCAGNFDVDATGDQRTQALYVAGDIEVNSALRIDLGARYENHEVQYNADTGALDGVPDVIVDYDESEASATLALNYAINDDMGVFARVNSGSKMPTFDDFRNFFGNFQQGDDLIADVLQYEFGYKLSTTNLSLYATGFFNNVKGNKFARVGSTVPNIQSENEAMGVEFDASYFVGSFRLDLNATIQETEVVEGPAGIEGKEVQRQPGYMVRFSPSYDIEINDSSLLTLYANATLVDDRFNDNLNTVTLDAYEKFDLGASLDVDQVSFLLNIDNITDEEGLTEGDPRNPTAPNGRLILPRTVNFSVSYNF